MNFYDYLFENTAKLEKEFVVGTGEQISFRILYEKSSSLATYLQAIAGTGKPILLMAPNSVFFIVAYLAILKSGNVAVPLSQETEQSGLDYIRQTCDSEIAFTTPRLAEKLHFNCNRVLTQVVVEDILKQSIPDQPSVPNPNDDRQPAAEKRMASGEGHQPSILSNHADQRHTIAGQDFDSTLGANQPELAEIIFTSGSTGKPKGVMITHGNLIANTASIVEYLKLTTEDRMLVVLPFYYCYGLSLLHTHLRAGGSLVLNNMFIMLGGVLNDLKKFACTGFAGVPSHFQILLRKSDSFKTAEFPHLRYVTQAGGKLHTAFIAEFLEAKPAVSFFVMYGQTEATARLSYLEPDRLPEKLGSCGKAIPGVELLVADENRLPVKPGETGEILARGANIMAGYFKDPDATAEALHNGWLRTGDLATQDDEGFIYLTARKKEIIKVGGRRISPKEIEEVIVAMPQVVDCTIEGVYDDILGEAMKAVIVLKEGTDDINADSIRIWCAARLAPYKIPGIIVLNSRVNISATGKKVKT